MYHRLCFLILFVHERPCITCFMLMLFGQRFVRIWNRLWKRYFCTIPEGTNVELYSRPLRPFRYLDIGVFLNSLSFSVMGLWILKPSQTVERERRFLLYGCSFLLLTIPVSIFGLWCVIRSRFVTRLTVNDVRKSITVETLSPWPWKMPNQQHFALKRILAPKHKTKNPQLIIRSDVYLNERNFVFVNSPGYIKNRELFDLLLNGKYPIK